ncbi:MAG: hypothetical protein AVDCRST_MAG79-1366, partial [uncultured Thermoleophilia bacterium]
CAPTTPPIRSRASTGESVRWTTRRSVTGSRRWWPRSIASSRRTARAASRAPSTPVWRRSASSSTGRGTSCGSVGPGVPRASTPTARRRATRTRSRAISA